MGSGPPCDMNIVASYISCFVLAFASTPPTHTAPLLGHCQLCPEAARETLRRCSLLLSLLLLRVQPLPLLLYPEAALSS